MAASDTALISNLGARIILLKNQLVRYFLRAAPAVVVVVVVVEA
jgi:hypothetical protein